MFSNNTLHALLKEKVKVRPEEAAPNCNRVPRQQHFIAVMCFQTAEPSETNKEVAMAGTRSARSRTSASRIGEWVLDNSGQIRAWLSLAAVILVGLWFALDLTGFR